jgi:hypothetical protein
MKSTRFAALLGALSLSLLLFGCGQARLHILIPDFVAKGVDGIRVYRLAPGGVTKLEGRISFGRLRSTSEGLTLEYTQSVPGHNTYGPLLARATRPRTGQLQIEMGIYNPGAPGVFKFATFNENGTSRPTTGTLYLAGAPQ